MTFSDKTPLHIAFDNNQLLFTVRIQKVQSGRMVPYLVDGTDECATRFAYRAKNEDGRALLERVGETSILCPRAPDSAKRLLKAYTDYIFPARLIAAELSLEDMVQKKLSLLMHDLKTNNGWLTATVGLHTIP